MVERKTIIILALCVFLLVITTPISELKLINYIVIILLVGGYTLIKLDYKKREKKAAERIGKTIKSLSPLVKVDWGGSIMDHRMVYTFEDDFYNEIYKMELKKIASEYNDDKFKKIKIDFDIQLKFLKMYKEVPNYSSFNSDGSLTIDYSINNTRYIININKDDISNFISTLTEDDLLDTKERIDELKNKLVHIEEQYDYYKENPMGKTDYDYFLNYKQVESRYNEFDVIDRVNKLYKIKVRKEKIKKIKN